mgnify:CR=1 FL=1
MHFVSAAAGTQIRAEADSKGLTLAAELAKAKSTVQEKTAQIKVLMQTIEALQALGSSASSATAADGKRGEAVGYARQLLL